MIPEAAVEAAARAHYAILLGFGDAEWDKLTSQRKNNRLYWMRAALEAAAPHMTGDPLMHAYAALGYTVCGLDTGGAISRGGGYEGPSHRSTIDAEHVTCDACRA